MPPVDYYAVNRDKVLADAKIYREKPENKTRIRAYQKEWRQRRRDYLRAQDRDKYQRTKEHRKSEAKAYYQAHKEDVKKYPSHQPGAQRRWRLVNIEKVRGYKLHARHGMSTEEYIDRVEAQGGRCSICQQPSRLNVDHCHTTKRLRDLLCRACNTGLGHFRDDTKFLQRAIEYLQRHREAI